jgi:class 3 adenylate cyclase
VNELLLNAQGDAAAVAAALADAAANPAAQGDGLGAVRAVLATRRAFSSARFEVPSARVSTVLSKEGAAGAPPPTSTEGLRAKADERGVAFELTGGDQGVLVVPIQMAAGGKGARGYLTVPVRTEKLREEFVEIAARRFDQGRVEVLLVDEGRHVVASAGTRPLMSGADAGGLPVWRALPAGTPWSVPVSVVSTHLVDGERMVGAVQTIPDLAWAVALWRPEREAYRALADMRDRALLVALAASLLSLLVAFVSSSALTRPILALVERARLLGARRWAEIPAVASRADELGDLEASLGQAARDLEQGEAELARQERVRTDLGRFLSRDLVDKIVRGEHSLALGGKRERVTVLFADIVGFTPMAEGKPPEQVVALLNELFSLLTEIVFRHGGTVDKFIGDCLMAVWGAAEPIDDHADRAIDAAGDMLRFLETANEGWKEKYGIEIRLGIGVNSGPVLVGNIGSDKRMEFTVIGDVVNVAARLEAIASPNQVLVGESTHELTATAFDYVLLGEKKLTGRSASSKVYELAL